MARVDAAGAGLAPLDRSFIVEQRAAVEVKGKGWITPGRLALVPGLRCEHGGVPDVMAQTIAMSTQKTPAPGTLVNLERAAQVGDRLGGHIVQGHIDGTSELLSATDGGAWRVLRFSLAANLAPLVASKGSIAIDGVSLTVSAVGDDWFEVSLIPETLTATTLGGRKVGELVNIETDIVARHVERMLQFTTSHPGTTTERSEQ